MDLNPTRTWGLVEAKNHLSEIVDRAIAGEPQEIARRGDPPVLVVSKSAVQPAFRRKRGSILDVLTKYDEIDFDIPVHRRSRRKNPLL